MRILIVEDEKKVAFIAKGFEEEGHVADAAHGGQARAYRAIHVKEFPTPLLHTIRGGGYLLADKAP